MRPRALAALALLWALGCEEKTEAERKAEIKREAEAEVVEQLAEAAPSAAPVAAPVATGAPVPASAAPVTFVWDHIGKLHQSFFRDAGATARLASDLAPHLTAAPRVKISYDDPKVQGFIAVELGKGGLTRPLVTTPTSVVLQDLAPLTTALSTYRDGIAMRYDLRIANFQAVVAMENAGITCRFMPVKTSPNNGTVISPCIVLGGAPICGEPGDGASVGFPAETMKRLRLCLGE